MGHVSSVVGTNILIQGGFFYDHSKAADGKMGSKLKDCYLNDLRVLDTETFV